MKTIAIVGASADRRKYGNKAVRAYAQQGYKVYPVNPREPAIEGLPAYRSLLDIPVAELDRVSLYVPAEAGMQALADIAKKKVGEIWLNPGADDPRVVARARELGLPAVQGCSIIDVGVRPGDFPDE